MNQAIAAGTWRTAGQQEAELGGVRVLRFRPPDEPVCGVLHLHGGGFRIGCPEMVAPFAASLVARCGVEVICPAYRLAPEYPFPAGLVDAHTVTKVLRQVRDYPLIISGDSAGGALAAGLTALSLVDEARPAGLVLLSPWLDLTATADSYDDYAASDPLFSRSAALQAAALYLQGITADDPLASPLFGPVTGFPPTLISFGQEEVLSDDGRRFYAKLQAAGAEAYMHAVTGMQHIAVVRNLSLQGAAETFAAVAEFIDRITGKSTVFSPPVGFHKY